MSLNPGQMLAHYRLLEKLGAGGMGEVHLAEDTKLKRKVALKVLPEILAANPERRMRFEREAQAVAALNHPNIVTLHSVEEAEGVHFLILELVEGQTLTQMISEKGMSLQEIFKIAIPLADAVATAHQQGITHRDLKPDNVMVTEDGRVKVLDFGLAKLREEPERESGTQLATATATQEGKILGTISYMSPEQAEGKPVAPPSDVFSMGVLLYEMATGQKPFKGDTPISTISAILRATPDPISTRNQTLPRHLARIVKRCLAKEASRRYPTAAELRNELEILKEEVDSGEWRESVPSTPETSVMKKTSRGWKIAAGMLAVTTVALSLWAFLGGKQDGTSATPGVQMQFSQLTYRAGVESFPNLSPDGNSLLYTAEEDGVTHIYLQRVGGRKPINLTQDSTDDNTHPAFSPDGDFIAFRSERAGGGIFVMGATGESVRRLTDRGYNPAWSPDGRELAFAAEAVIDPLSRDITSHLHVVEASTGETRQIYDGDAVQPSYSPHGRWIAFWTNHPDERDAGQRDLQMIRPDGSEKVDLLHDLPVDWNPVWSADGRFLYFASDRGGSMNLWRLPVDEDSGKVLGEPEAVTVPSNWSGPFALSATGKQIAYSSRDLRMNISGRRVDLETGKAAGPEFPVTRGTLALTDADVSPDGEWIVCRSGGRKEDIYVVKTDGTGLRRLTDDHYKNRGTVWSADGKEIVFYSNRGGNYEIWSIRQDGSNLRRLVESPGEDMFWGNESPSGEHLKFYGTGIGTFLVSSDELPARLADLEPLPPVDRDTGDVFSGNRWSADGRRLAGSIVDKQGVFTSQWAIYSLDSGDYQRLELPRPGDSPLGWAGNDRLLIQRDQDLLTLDLNTGSEIKVAEGLGNPGFLVTLTVSRDLKSIYYVSRSEEADIWLATLK